MMSREEHTKEEWFKSWFNELYLQVYQHRNSAEAELFMNNLLIQDRLNCGGKALDIGCGSGRYAHLIAQKGFITYGLDLSMLLLRRAVQENRDSDVAFVQSDMRAIPFNTQFNLIVCLFTSFGYFESDSEHLSVLRSVATLLRQGGCFVLDVPNPKSVLNRVKSEPASFRTSANLEIVEERAIVNCPLRVNKRITIKENNKTDEYYESVRLFSKTEIYKMTTRAGLREITPMWGGYDGTQLNDASDRMIYFGERDD